MIPVAGSVTGRPLAIPDLVARSDIVVIGTVATVRSDWHSTRKIVFTGIKLEVDEVLKGSVTANSLNFYQTGGRSGAVVSAIAGTPVFDPQERVLLFLYMNREGRLAVVGLFQGKFSIEMDSSSGQQMVVRRVPGVLQPLDKIPLEQARRLVRNAVGD